MSFRATFVSACGLLAAGAASLSASPSWDWQLSDPFDLSRDVDVMDIDPDNHTAAEIAALTARGIQTICYVSVGTVETYRDDVDQFPESVVGNIYDEWPDERFLDIRRIDVLLPLMTARFERCKELGFDAIEPDNQDVHDNESGFPITAENSVAYLRALAEVAHELGLSIGQKNVPELTPYLSDTFDFIVTEDCFQDAWCSRVMDYAQQGKPIYAAEYTDTGVDFDAACAWGAANEVSFILKDRNLTRSLETCP